MSELLTVCVGTSDNVGSSDLNYHNFRQLLTSELVFCRNFFDTPIHPPLGNIKVLTPILLDPWLGVDVSATEQDKNRQF